jgi:hypothetical protein
MGALGARAGLMGALGARALRALRAAAILSCCGPLVGGLTAPAGADLDILGHPGAHRSAGRDAPTPRRFAALTPRTPQPCASLSTALVDPDRGQPHGWVAPGDRPDWEALLALAHFGLLSCGALLLRQRAQNRALRWACGALGYSNAVLALGGVMGNRCDLLGVPLFAMLSIPAMFATSSALCALTFVLLAVKPDALPGGLLGAQLLVGSVGFLTVHSILVHVWSHSNMVADSSWSAVGLIVYNAEPRLPTMTLLLSPLLLVGGALRLGLQEWKAKRGAGLLAGALALASGILGPEASCVWSWQLAQLLMSLALSVRPEISSAATGTSTAAPANDAGPLKLALRAAAEAAAGGGSRGRMQLVEGLHRIGKGLGLEVDVTGQVAHGSGEAGEGRGRHDGRAAGLASRATHHWSETVYDGLLLCAGALVPQFAAALARATLRYSTGKRLDQAAVPAHVQSGTRTDVRIAANTLLVSPHMHMNSAQGTGMVHRSDPDATHVHAGALAHEALRLSAPEAGARQVQPSSLAHTPQQRSASTGKHVPGVRPARAHGASNVTPRHGLQRAATKAALTRVAGVGKGNTKGKTSGVLGALVARRLAKPRPNPPLADRPSPSTPAGANKRARAPASRRSGNGDAHSSVEPGAGIGQRAAANNEQSASPPPAATSARQAPHTVSPSSPGARNSGRRGRPPAHT